MSQVQDYLSTLRERMSHFDSGRLKATGSANWLRPGTAFLRELLREPRSVGAVCPSSSRLAERMAGWVNPAPGGWVVELGGGTGAVTAALLRHGVPRERLVVIEQSPHFVHHLRKRFPKVRIFHGDAANIAHAVEGARQVNTLVSGLPLRSLPESTVDRIVQACTGALSPDARVIQFTYAPRAPSAWGAAGLQRVGNEIVWHNLPPARIEVFTPR